MGEALAEVEVVYRDSIEVSGRQSRIAGETRKRRQSREARTAEVEVRAARLCLRGPARPGGALPDVDLNVVEVREFRPPSSETAIHWQLWTTLSIATPEDLQNIIAWYCLR